MILSHACKFIFLKTQKTAGTSMEIGLSRFCGTRDVITPVSRKDERLRRQMGYRRPQNYTRQRHGFGRVADAVWPRGRERLFYNHMSATEVRERIDADVWRNYFKFCIERNPWDRVISLYHYWWQREPRPTLTEFVASDAPLMLKRKGIDLYMIDGAVVVDRVLRFENLRAEAQELKQQLGFPADLELPYAKSGYRKDPRHYRELLTDVDAARIAEMFADEIRLFGYEF